MKQSILFEQGKLYVVELPEKPIKLPSMGNTLSSDNYMRDLTKYNIAHAAALANKVDVKNPELLKDDYPLLSFWMGKDTYPMPADLNFDKETGMLKRIEPEKPEETVPKSNDKVLLRLLDNIQKDVERLNSEHQEYIDQLIQDKLNHLSRPPFNSSIEHFLKTGTVNGSFLEAIKDILFTIQCKKS